MHPLYLLSWPPGRLDLLLHLSTASLMSEKLRICGDNSNMEDACQRGAGEKSSPNIVVGEASMPLEYSSVSPMRLG